jgi:hypothetical protein
MSRQRRNMLFLITCHSLALAATGAFGQPVVDLPSAEAIVSLSRAATFQTRAVSDRRLLPQVRKLNPQSSLQVYFRDSASMAKFEPSPGAVLARLVLRGIPDGRGLPDGEYYLWIGGTSSMLRGALAKSDATVVQAVHSEIELQPPTAMLRPPINLPSVPLQKQRWWRHVCVNVALSGQDVTELCGRLPAN